MAEKLAADPFTKVKQLIDNMITRLLEEAHADADHEGFCDTEMGKSKIARTKLTEDIDGLNGEVEEGKATILRLGEEVKALSAEVADLIRLMGEATEMRKTEKAQNAATVADAQAAQKAVAAAIAVLKEFYEQAGTATAFVQTGAAALRGPVKMGSEEWNELANPNFDGTVDHGSVDLDHKQGMQTFGETYEGQQQESGGVLALMQVIQSDFATLQADTEAAEAENQKTYYRFMTDSQKSQAMKERKIEMNTADKAAAEAKLREDITDLKRTQDELLAADRYHAKLVPQCIDAGMTFDERTKAREAEIASLKEALQILGREDIATTAL